jgi:hypothetical protein
VLSSAAWLFQKSPDYIIREKTGTQAPSSDDNKGMIEQALTRTLITYFGYIKNDKDIYQNASLVVSCSLSMMR